MKLLNSFIIVLLLIYTLEAENKLNIKKIVKPGIKKIEKNILSLESRNIGIYGFDIQTDNQEFDIHKVWTDISKALKRNIGKIEKVKMINEKKLLKVGNKYSIFKTYDIKKRKKLKKYFKEVSLDLLVTGKMIYKNNELTISLSYIDKKHLSEIRVFKKEINEKQILMNYFKEHEPRLNPVRFLLYNKDAKNVMLSFKGKNISKIKPIKMKKLPQNEGFWAVTLKLEPGIYQYLYIVNGKEQFDPKNTHKEDDGFAGILSVVEVKEVEETWNGH